MFGRTVINADTRMLGAKPFRYLACEGPGRERDKRDVSHCGQARPLFPVASAATFEGTDWVWARGSVLKTAIHHDCHHWVGIIVLRFDNRTKWTVNIDRHVTDAMPNPMTQPFLFPPMTVCASPERQGAPAGSLLLLLGPDSGLATGGEG